MFFKSIKTRNSSFSCDLSFSASISIPYVDDAITLFVIDWTLNGTLDASGVLTGDLTSAVHDGIGFWEACNGTSQRGWRAGWTADDMAVTVTGNDVTGFDYGVVFYQATGYDEISLLSLSTSDYPQLAELIERLKRENPHRTGTTLLRQLALTSGANVPPMSASSTPRP